MLITMLNMSTHLENCETVNEDTNDAYITKITHNDEIMATFRAVSGGIHWNYSNDDWFEFAKLIRDENIDIIQAIVKYQDRFPRFSLKSYLNGFVEK